MTGEQALARIRSTFEQKIAETPSVQALIDKINAGKATFADTDLYARWAAINLGMCLSDTVCDIDPEDRPAVCRALLFDRYEDINGFLAQVQAELDSRFGIRIGAKKATFPEERVSTIGQSLADPDKPDEVIRRRARSTSTVAMSFHDDYMKTNAKHRARLGLKCYITRKTDGKCCPWCTKLAGRYVYGEEPEDVYHRHDNCGCSVTYENGRERTDVWSKRTWTVDPKTVHGFQPTVLAQEQAQALQENALSRLTLPGKRDRMSMRDDGDFWQPITEQSIREVPEISAFSSDDVNSAVQTQCRELLSELIQDEIGTEGTVSIRLSDLSAEMQKGESGEGAVKPIHLNEPYISIHNHPSDETFSAADLRILCTDNNCGAIIVIGNSGKNTFVLKKTDSFDVDGLMQYIRSRVSETSHSVSIHEFLKGSEKYGTKYYC